MRPIGTLLAIRFYGQKKSTTSAFFPLLFSSLRSFFLFFSPAIFLCFLFCFAFISASAFALAFFFQTQKRVSLLGSVRFAGSEISWPMSGLNGGPKECLQKNERVSEREIDGSELVVAKAYKKR